MRLSTYLVVVSTILQTSSFPSFPFYSHRLAWCPFFGVFYRQQHPYSNFEVDNEKHLIKPTEKSRELNSELVLEMNKVLSAKANEAFNRIENLKDNAKNQFEKLQQNGHNKYDLSIRIT